MFRSAADHELVVRGNPFRRPVRPEDVEFIKLAKPVTSRNASSLTSLISGRALLNALETDVVYGASALVPDDAAEFLGPENRARARRVDGYLATHLFAEVEREAARRFEELGEDGAVSDALARCSRSVTTVASSALRAEDPTLARETLAIQLALVYYGAVVPDSADSDAVAAFIRATGLGIEPHSHYQFYLPSSLRLRCYEGLVGRPAASSFRADGARAGERFEMRLFGRVLLDLHSEHGEPSEPERLADDVVAFVAAVNATHGAAAGTEAARGVVERQILRTSADVDYLRQIAWVSRFKTYRELGAEIYGTILNDKIEVDLETYVESSAECSTTHVHDTDRLLVIETGEMDFWNAVNTEHRFRAGDCFLIPRHRLHGSVVRSGSCTYHQPIIPKWLMKTSVDACSAAAEEMARLL